MACAKWDKAGEEGIGALTSTTRQKQSSERYNVAMVLSDVLQTRDMITHRNREPFFSQMVVAFLQSVQVSVTIWITNSMEQIPS